MKLVLTEAPTVSSPIAGLPSHRIPSLDGLRAASISLVILGHASRTFAPSLPGHNIFHGLAATGVSVFFVISGFLITTLLLQEQERTGRISIRNFYLRRGFRIWPAFYIYIGVVTLLAAAKIVIVSRAQILSAAFYVWNYASHTDSWFVGHTWSLAVEEQFYLLWPLALAVLGSRRVKWLAVALLVSGPAIRAATYLLFPALRGRIGMMLHTRTDTLMFGAAAAIFFDSPQFQAVMRRLFAWKLPQWSALFLLTVHPLLSERVQGKYLLSVGWTLEGCAIVVVLLWVVKNPDTVAGRFLNWKPVVHIGLISYSLYLWQQLFLTNLNTTFTGRFPVNVLCALLAAQFSYSFIERPFLRWRSRLLRA